MSLNPSIRAASKIWSVCCIDPPSNSVVTPLRIAWHMPSSAERRTWSAERPATSRRAIFSRSVSSRI